MCVGCREKVLKTTEITYAKGVRRPEKYREVKTAGKLLQHRASNRGTASCEMEQKPAKNRRVT